MQISVGDKNPLILSLFLFKEEGGGAKEEECSGGAGKEGEELVKGKRELRRRSVGPSVDPSAQMSSMTNACFVFCKLSFPPHLDCSPNHPEHNVNTKIIRQTKPASACVCLVCNFGART